MIRSSTGCIESRGVILSGATLPHSREDPIRGSASQQQYQQQASLLRRVPLSPLDFLASSLDRAPVQQINSGREDKKPAKPPEPFERLMVLGPAQVPLNGLSKGPGCDDHSAVTQRKGA